MEWGASKRGGGGRDDAATYDQRTSNVEGVRVSADGTHGSTAATFNQEVRVTDGSRCVTQGYT